MSDNDESEPSSSDSDDQEYIPEENFSSSCSEVSEGEREERVRGVGRRGERRGGRKKRQKPTRQTRKRRGGIHLKEEEPKTSSPADKSSNDSDSVEEREGEEEEEEGEEGEKAARIDDLWASFKEETGFRTRQIPTKTSKLEQQQQQQPKTVKIKKAYDFAGEEVVVEKEVAANSKEAMQFLHSRSEVPPPKEESEASVEGPPPSIAGTKRGSGLSSVLQSLSKKPKMSTLEKSRIDWLQYKRDEGVEDELTQHNKDGYLERQEFLHRADLRQFEQEKEERLKRFKRLH